MGVNPQATATKGTLTFLTVQTPKPSAAKIAASASTVTPPIAPVPLSHCGERVSRFECMSHSLLVWLQGTLTPRAGRLQCQGRYLG